MPRRAVSPANSTTRAEQALIQYPADHEDRSITRPLGQRLPQRRGGLLVFNLACPLKSLCADLATDQLTTCLQNDYLGMYPFEWPENTVEFQLPYGEWIRLSCRHGLAVEDLIELRPAENATTTYEFAPLAWARRWPAEHIWKVGKPASTAADRLVSRLWLSTWLSRQQNGRS